MFFYDYLGKGSKGNQESFGMMIFNNVVKRLIPICKEEALMQAIGTGWGVKGMVFRGDEVLVLFNPNGGYDLPGGRLEANESFCGGLRREILEETGIKKVVVTNSSAPWSFRNRSGRLVRGTTWVCHYVNGEVFLSSEHSGFAWKPVRQMKDLDIYHKYGLENLISGFTK